MNRALNNYPEDFVIKMLDKVLLAEKDDANFFVPGIFVHNSFYEESKDKIGNTNSISEAVKEYGRARGFWEIYPNGNCKLTDKGYEAKDAGGHLKYKNSLEKRTDGWRKTEVISAVIATVISLVSLYFSWKTNDELSLLKNKVEANSRLQAQFETQVDSLSSEFYSLKTKMLSDSIIQ